jgi:hypothetical protein
MKLPVRLAKSPTGPDQQPRLLDADGVFVCDLRGGIAEADIQRIVLSINALGKVPLESIRALYPRAHWVTDTEGAKP